MMMMGRHWLFRVSICANLFVLIYLALYTTTTTNPTTTTPIDLNPASSLPNFPQNPSQAQYQHSEAQQPPIPPPSSDDINAGNNYETNGIGGGDGGGISSQNNAVVNEFGDGSSKSQSENLNSNNNNYNANNERDFVNDAVVIDDPVPAISNRNNNGVLISDNTNSNAIKFSSRETVLENGAPGTGINSDSNNNNNNNLNEIELNEANKLLQIESMLQQESSNRKMAALSSFSSSSSTPSSLVSFVNNNNNNPGAQRQKLFPCDDREPLRTHFGQRGPFWVFYNYFSATKYFLCDESITLTTHADFTFLDNLIPLLRRWQGPISLALYAPGTDFNETLTRILYLRECHEEISAQIKELVTFHIFFDYKHIPKQRIVHDPSTIQFNCNNVFNNNNNASNSAGVGGGALNSSGNNDNNSDNAIKFGDSIQTYKKTKRLPYPVNVARNVAREQVTTHYILASDIELYPNPNLIPDFINMLRRKNESIELQRPNPNKLFVLSIFEVQANVTALPEDKGELVYMLRNKSAIPFHKYVCPDCHRIPKANEWISSSIKTGLNIFHVGKRKKPFQHWEPIYIGTRFDPMYDERLTWEGRSDKMTQGYVLCVLDYEFHILDNAFLVHRPGIKTSKMVMIPAKNPVVAKQNAVIAKIILPELKLLYGTRPGCVL